MVQACITDSCLESFQFLTGSFSHQFHPAIRKVSNHSSHLIPHRRVLRRVSKPNPLHPPAIQNPHPAPFHILLYTFAEHILQFANRFIYKGEIKPYSYHIAQTFYLATNLVGEPGEVLCASFTTHSRFATR
jgi:hypothetical protein